MCFFVFGKKQYFSRGLQSTIPRDYFFNGLSLAGDGLIRLEEKISGVILFEMYGLWDDHNSETRARWNPMKW